VLMRAVRSASQAERRRWSEARVCLGDGLDRDRTDLLVAIHLEHALGVGPVGLGAAHVGAHGVWWQQQRRVTEGPSASCLGVSRAAGFHDDGCRRELREHERELLAGVAVLPCNLSRVVGDGDLEDGLCQIDSDESMVRHGWVPSFAFTASHFGT